MKTKDKLLQEYRSIAPRLNLFGRDLQTLIEKLVRTSGLKVHSVSHRVKDEASLAEKLQRPDRNYQKLSDVTDLCGVRIVTYFEEDVDRVADLLRAEFTIHPEFSIDKREALEPDRFGYLSLHYIVSLPPHRQNLTEYAGYRGCIAEIQVRSILQHAWAEMEHDLGYKRSVEVPRKVARQFSRLAGLLEIADEGFAKLRRELADYRNEVSEIIESAPEAVPIDAVSLQTFMTADPEVDSIEREVMNFLGARERSFYGPDVVAEFTTAARRLGFSTIRELKTALGLKSNQVLGLLRHMFRDDVGAKTSLSRGIALYYLLLVEAYTQGGLEQVKNAFPMYAGVQPTQYEGFQRLAAFFSDQQSRQHRLQ